MRREEPGGSRRPTELVDISSAVSYIMNMLMRGCSTPAIGITTHGDNFIEPAQRLLGMRRMRRVSDALMYSYMLMIYRVIRGRPTNEWRVLHPIVKAGANCVIDKQKCQNDRNYRFSRSFSNFFFIQFNILVFVVQFRPQESRICQS